MFDIEDYNYDLPERLIAQVPATRRSTSRLLVVERLGQSFSSHCFCDLPKLLKPGDLLVVNNTKVVPAKLFGRKETGGRIEILVLEHANCEVPKSNTRWCLLRSSKRPNKGSLLYLECGVLGRVEELAADGLAKITFEGGPPIDSLMEEKGLMPLPPYIKRDRQDGRSTIDRERYQTIFSKKRGAVAAPTAGLHFTNELFEKLKAAGVSVAEITLHVGHGTFRPVREKDIRKHKLGEECYRIDPGTASAINNAKKDGRRILAVGTTVVRALETTADSDGKITSSKRKTDLLIIPGFRFRVVDGMITNFHLPKSSLLFLVGAFTGLELIKKAYHWAIQQEYRFYSYGDAMLII